MGIRRNIRKEQKQKRDREIFKVYSETSRSATDIGYAFGLSRTSVLRIIREQIKKHTH
jgi:hypothetical protein